MTFNRILLFFFLFLFLVSPTYALASGGGPLLILFNASVFIVGQIWILGVEYFLFSRRVEISKADAFADVFFVNLLSTLAVTFGLSLLIAIAGLAGSFLPDKLGLIISSIGTWVLEGSEYNRFSIYITFFWYAILLCITVFFEAWIYRRRWKKRGFSSNVNLIALSWQANAISHFGLLVAIFVIWRDLIN